MTRPLLTFESLQSRLGDPKPYIVWQQFEPSVALGWAYGEAQLARPIKRAQSGCPIITESRPTEQGMRLKLRLAGGKGGERWGKMQGWGNLVMRDAWGFYPKSSRITLSLSAANAGTRQSIKNVRRDTWGFLSKIITPHLVLSGCNATVPTARKANRGYRDRPA